MCVLGEAWCVNVSVVCLCETDCVCVRAVYARVFSVYV